MQSHFYFYAIINIISVFSLHPFMNIFSLAFILDLLYIGSSVNHTKRKDVFP